MKDFGNSIHGLLNFMDASVCNFYAIHTLRHILDHAGFTELDRRNHWELHRGGKYYTTANGSALFAFIVGEGDAAEGFKIISAHSDSPGFRIKPSAEMVTDGNIVKLNTEVYGGPILYTWFDRPLSIAGRVILRTDDPLRPETRLIRIDRPLLTIPHLAIHFNRQVNDGNPLSKQKDMLPVLGHISERAEADGLLIRLVSEQLGVESSRILDLISACMIPQKAVCLGLMTSSSARGAWMTCRWCMLLYPLLPHQQAFSA